MPLPHTSSLLYPIAPDSLPPRPLDQPPYLVTFANSPEDLDAVLRLRFDVFNLELREGFAESYRTGRDEDAFDRVMHHLMVIKMPEREVVGTYDRQFGTIDFFMLLDVQQLAPAVFDAYFQSTPI